jgi:hypothetical protein
LWDILDQNPVQETIKEIFVNWLSQTGMTDTAGWIQRCNAVLTKAKARVDNATQDEKAAKKAAATDLQDEEVAGFAAGAGTKDEDASASTSSQELMRWQVRLFGMELLNSLLDSVVKESAINEDIPALSSLQQRVSDVVRVAFSASTANVVGLRILGLHIIDQVLRVSTLVHASSTNTDHVTALWRRARPRLHRSHASRAIPSTNQFRVDSCIRRRLFS